MAEYFEDLEDGLGEVVASFDRQDFRHAPMFCAVVPKPVASYTVINHSGPVPQIACPGVPPHLMFNEDEEPLDTEERYLDIGLFPTAPFAPLFAAVRHCSPELDLSPIQLVTDRRILKLFCSWLEGRSGGGRKNLTARVDVELAASGAVILMDWEASHKWAVLPFKGDISLYWTRKGPPLGGTRWDKHYRVTQVHLDRLSILMRHTVEATLQSHPRASTVRAQERPKDFDVKVYGTYGQDQPGTINLVSYPPMGATFAYPEDIVEVKSHKRAPESMHHRSRGSLRFIGLHNTVRAAMLSQATHLLLVDSFHRGGSVPESVEGPVLVPRQEFLAFPEAHAARQQLARLAVFLQSLLRSLTEKGYPPGARLALRIDGDALNVHVREAELAGEVALEVHYVQE